MFARRFRAAAVLAVTLTAVATVGCVRGRNDGGRDAAGMSSNGAGPAAQPGPLGGQNRDTTMLPAAATAAPAPATSAPAAPAAAAPAPAAAKKAP